MQKILFLTTAHRFDDDRIFYHQALELVKNGKQVKICSLSSDFVGPMQGVAVEAYSVLDKKSSEKIKVFRKVIEGFQPDVIICSEPLAVIAAKKCKHKSKIIYDVTEWYPSYRMLQPYSGIAKFFHGLKFKIIHLFAGFIAHRFIFGEASKKSPLTFFFPFKKNILLPYFPDSCYIKKSINTLNNNAITLAYTGRISKEDGMGNFFNAIENLKKQRPNLKISVLIIGKPKREEDKLYFENLLQTHSLENLVVEPPVSLPEFSAALSRADICLDLRENNSEYSASLPIKIFYYIASGKPVIYTRLQALDNYMKVSEFGKLVNPEEAKTIADFILEYIDNPHLYNQHAQNARKNYEEKYNWGVIKYSFLEIIE